jgi:hypothetical protein
VVREKGDLRLIVAKFQYAVGFQVIVGNNWFERGPKRDPRVLSCPEGGE